MAALGGKNVSGFYVTVDNAFRVRGVQSIGDVDREGQQLIVLHRGSADQVLEGAAFQVLHGDKGLRVLFANVVNGADVGMIERRRGASFPLESG